MRILPLGFAMCILVGGAQGVSAQTGLPPLSSDLAPGAQETVDPRPINVFPVLTGQPFRAEKNSRTIETLPDGTQKVLEFHGTVARNSQGSVAQFARVAAISPHVVTDPVAGARFEWHDDANAMVVKRKLLPEQMGAQPLDACERVRKPDVFVQISRTQTVEERGSSMIDGIAVTGCRVTTVIPVSSASTNREPVTIVDETWTSAELRIVLRHTQQRLNGSSVVEQIDHIVRGEPDSKLFELPPSFAMGLPPVPGPEDQSQGSAVPNFRFDIQTGADGKPRFSLTNDSRRALAAAHIEFFRSPETKMQGGTDWDPLLTRVGTWLAPGASMTMPLPYEVGHPYPDQVKVVAGIWSDGETFGDDKWVRMLLQERADRKSDYEWAIALLREGLDKDWNRDQYLAALQGRSGGLAAYSIRSTLQANPNLDARSVHGLAQTMLNGFVEQRDLLIQAKPQVDVNAGR